MSTIRIFAGFAVLLAALAGASPLRAQAEDVFAFIPDGGRTLFATAVEGASAEEVNAILTAEKTRDEWLDYFAERAATLPGFGGLDDHQRLTLADYLSFNMPLAEGDRPAHPASADWPELLPLDGRDLALNECQFCHIITVVVTQEKTTEAWLGTMHKPSHIEIRLTEREREALASYLVLNAAIPADLVPEELRAGGASY